MTDNRSNKRFNFADLVVKIINILIRRDAQKTYMIFISLIVVCLGISLLIMGFTGKFNFSINLPILNAKLCSELTGLFITLIGGIIISVDGSQREKVEKEREHFAEIGEGISTYNRERISKEKMDQSDESLFNTEEMGPPDKNF